MARTLSATIQAAIGEHVTEPGFLVYVGLGTPLRWSTRGEVTWDSETWYAAGLEINSVAPDKASISIRNDNGYGSALALDNQLRDVQFRIYAYYDGDAQEIFRGYGGGASISMDSVSINLYASRSDGTKVPKMRIANPLFTNLPVVGTTIRWGNDELKVTI